MRYVAFFRGLNVGSSTRVPMARLREIFAAAGASDVASYVQSGNVVFDVTPSTVETVAATVLETMKGEFGVPTWLVLRTAAEMTAIVARNPFVKEAAVPTTVHVVFFADAAPEPAHGTVPDGAADAFVRSGREIYVFTPHGISKGAFPPAFWNRDMKAGTARNWRTVTRLASMLEDG